jgi:hypothetical protein
MTLPCERAQILDRFEVALLGALHGSKADRGCIVNLGVDLVALERRAAETDRRSMWLGQRLLEVEDHRPDPTTRPSARLDPPCACELERLRSGFALGGSKAAL